MQTHSFTQSQLSFRLLSSTAFPETPIVVRISE